MKKVVIIFILLIFVSRISAQEIGQDALTVKSIVEYYVKNYYDSQGYKQVKMRTDTKYYNGKISEVVLYQENVPALDEELLGRTFDYKTRYVMKNNLLNKLITEYNNLSIEELKSITDDKNKIGDLYFTANYTFFNKIYLNANGLATKEYRKTNLDELPINVKSIIETNKSKMNELQLKNKFERQILKRASPAYEVDAEGVVIIEVSINRSGNVVKAVNTNKSTTSNKDLIKSSIEAALKSQFSPIEKDTIIKTTLKYNFELK
jgi:hypothetical protein